MTVKTIDAILLLLLFCHCGKSEVVTTCDRSISLQCLSQQIVIFDVSATTNISSLLLEQCNTHQECNVLNTNQECLQVAYWCKRNGTFEEVGPLVTTRVKKKHISNSLTSQRYRKGIFQEAQNLNCSITPSNSESDVTKNLTIWIYELAPFISSSTYCLSVKNSRLPPFCSGSRKVYTMYGTIPGTNNWQISLALSKDASYVPLVRFWIGIKLLPEDDRGYDLQCTSKSAVILSTSYISLLMNQSVELKCTMVSLRNFVALRHGTSTRATPSKPVAEEVRLAWNVILPATFCGICALLTAGAIGYMIKNKRSRSVGMATEPSPSQLPAVPSFEESKYYEIKDEYVLDVNIPAPPLAPARSRGSIDYAHHMTAATSSMGGAHSYCNIFPGSIPLARSSLPLKDLHQQRYQNVSM